jgi:hypothetical protein
VRDRPLDQIDGDVMLPDLRGKHAEEMQRIGVIGLQRQRLAIERFGLRKPAGLVMGKARCKKTSNARVRRRRATSPGGRLAGAAKFAVHVLVPISPCDDSLKAAEV